MSKPQVITIPANAGFGTVPPVQIPLSDGSAVTLINLDYNLGVTLCNDSNFAPSSVWPLQQLNALPITDVNNLWVQNPNNANVELLVLAGVMPVALYNPKGAP